MTATEKSVKKLWILLAVFLCLSVLLLVGIYVGVMRKSDTKTVTSYAECINTKDAVLLETYPEQCVVDGKSFANPAQQMKSEDPAKPQSDQEAVLAAYTAKNGVCKSTETAGTKVKKVTGNGWAELSAICEPGSGHIEVWHKVNGTWTYVIGYQDGPYCTMVIDNNISKELYATCVTTEEGPTSTNNEFGQPTIPNQIP